MIKSLNRAIEKSILAIESDAKKMAPVNKSPTVTGGTLRQSIRSLMTGPARGVVMATADYALYVHEGTRPHTIRVRRRKVLANRRAKQFFGKVVQHPGTKAQPFLQQAVDRNRTFIETQFNQAVKEALK